MSESIRVALGAHPYNILLTDDLDELGRAMAPLLAPSRTIVIVDATVAGLYGEAALASLRAAGLVADLITFPAGEESKCLDQAMRLYDALVDRRADRRSAVVALGGGVTGDLAGFVAATFMRGIPYVQVPTTVLAQVDSSVGGKTGVNHPRGKNLIGAFHQPRLVYSDLTTLRSLPAEELRNGMAEVIKHGVIRDAAYFDYVEAHASEIKALDMPVLYRVIGGSCRIKAAVVAADEREAGLRAILNFGHTAAHAIETLTGYGRYGHGEAVAMGMTVANRLGTDLLGFPHEQAQRVEAALRALGLRTRFPDLDADTVVEAMFGDKKAQAGTLRFVLPEAIGTVRVVPVTDLNAIRRAIDAARV